MAFFVFLLKGLLLLFSRVVGNSPHYFYLILETTNNFLEFDTSSYSNEVQLDEVDASCWFHIDITDKLVTVDNLGGVVCFVTDHAEIVDTATTLNITQEWLN